MSCVCYVKQLQVCVVFVELVKVCFKHVVVQSYEVCGMFAVCACYCYLTLDLCLSQACIMYSDPACIQHQ